MKRDVIPAITQAIDLTHTPQAVQELIDDDTHGITGVIYGDKIIKIKGQRYTIGDALIVAAMCLNAEERKVILDDCGQEIQSHLMAAIDREEWA